MAGTRTWIHTTVVVAALRACFARAPRCRAQRPDGEPPRSKVVAACGSAPLLVASCASWGLLTLRGGDDNGSGGSLVQLLDGVAGPGTTLAAWGGASAPSTSASASSSEDLEEPDPEDPSKTSQQTSHGKTSM